MNAGDRTRLTAAQAHALDAALAERLALPSLLLMENAGRGAADEIDRRFGATATASRMAAQVAVPFAVVLCGPGNNGGDGFVVARHLDRLGWRVRVLDAADRPRQGDAARMQAIVARLAAAGGDRAIELQAVGADAGADGLVAAIPDSAIVVDALLGTGSHGEPRGTVAALLSALAARAEPLRGRVALDLPSGVDADSGRASAAAFRADLTLTFAAEKRGLRHGDGPLHTSAIFVIDLGVRGGTALAQLPTTAAGGLAGDAGSGSSSRPLSAG